MLFMLHIFFTIVKWLHIFFLVICFLPGFAQKFDAEVINQQTVIDVSKGKLSQTHSFEIRINNRNGDKYAEVSIPFNKMNTVSGIEAGIYDISGIEIQKLKKSAIVEKSKSSPYSFYEDTFVKEFSLRNNSYPYILKYTYRIEASQFIFVSYWIPIIDNDIPTFGASLSVRTKSDFPLLYHSNLVLKPEIDSISGYTTYLWRTSYKDPVKPEAFSPPLTEFIPFVSVVPYNFNYEKAGSHESWKTFGNWNLSLLDGLSDLPEMEKLKINSLVSNIADEKEKIRILFHYLQDETRYINVSIKTGGLKPFPASYVTENKYGDCKALANYFKACLAQVNIKSFYSTINAGEEIETINPGFPSQQFNHVILFIPLKQDTLWVDCTSDLAFNYLGTFTQNRFALVLDLNSSKLIRTPELTFSDVLETRNIKANISTEKLLYASFTNTYKGNKYELLSEIMNSLSESQRRQFLTRFVESGFRLDEYSLLSSERDTHLSILKYKASTDQMITDYGAEVLVKIIPLKFDFLEEPRKRKLPVLINYPVYRIDTVEYTIPDNYKISVFPKNIAINSIFGEYHADFQINDHSVMAIKQVRIYSGSCPLNNYQLFYNFMISIDESENSSYITLIKN